MIDEDRATKCFADAIFALDTALWNLNEASHYSIARTGLAMEFAKKLHDIQEEIHELKQDIIHST